jgi:flavin-dependent dehydrogenase
MSVNEASIPSSADVVVIGGGPAGSTTATMLAREGVDVVLLEKVKHPRPTVGESLIPHFWKFADREGVSGKLEQEGFLKKAGGITVWNGRIHQFSFESFGYTRPALHVERDVHDEILLRHSASQGAKVFEEVGVASVDFSNPANPEVHYADKRGGTTSNGKIKARHVVDASGHSVVLAKQFGSRQIVGKGVHDYIGLWGYYKDSRYIAADGKAYGQESLPGVKPVTFVLSYADGWIWHIVLRNNVTSVGLIVNTNVMSGLGKEGQVPYFKRICETTPYLKELLAGATFVEGSLKARHDYSYYSSKVCGEGFFCVGDAGGFVDPIFSHGVQAAHYNGHVAAAVVKATLDSPHNAEEHRKMFDLRIRQYYGFSRSLALGDFTGDGVDTALVHKLMKSMPPVELEMMLVASCISDRSHNFHAMAKDAGVEGDFADGFRSARHRLLPTLEV